MLFNVVKINKVNRSIWEKLEIRQRERVLCKVWADFFIVTFCVEGYTYYRAKFKVKVYNAIF